MTHLQQAVQSNQGILMTTRNDRLAPVMVNGRRISKNDEIQIKVLPGGYYVGYGEFRIATTLGSCISMCLRDPQAGVGGINHFMLPEGEDKNDDCWQMNHSTRYGINAMEIVINEIIKRGGSKERLEVKLFGGGHVIPGMRCEIGTKNIEFARRFLEIENIAIVAQDVGSHCSRRLIYDVSSGNVLIKRVNSDASMLVSQRDSAYVTKVANNQQTGSIELFE